MNGNTVSASVADQASATRQVSWAANHLTLAGMHWPGPAGTRQEPPVVLLHGWLDNCLSFVRLAPELARTADVYAVDMAGHGLSDHRAAAQSYALVDYVTDLASLLDQHFAGPVRLVGHSLGGIVAALYAAAFPEKVHRLVLIDSLGPLTRAPEQYVEQLRRGINKRLAGSGAAAVYPSVEAAAKVRMGGLSPLSRDAAMALVPRNLRAVPGGYQWRTDAKLRHPSLMMMSDSQVLASLRALRMDTLLVRAQGGMLADREGFRERLAAVAGLQEVIVAGSHHCHLDGDTEPVTEAIREFLFSA
ncbi:alpha/beta fold hydrolase [Marinobacter sp. X15-166B]|uniref:alpha/beta fold hydrolase n=1 Tax=Marinobacter sp. X15-166B TaxID=1897620 RepID=UPI000AEDFEC4|nr:alpha/beta fold hydrolase [Marinobacter sp. X15-166B]